MTVAMPPSAASRNVAALSPIVAGAWRLAEWDWPVAQRLRWIEALADLGITSFDHADIYGDYRVEARFGEALAQAPASLRERLQIVSKCGIRLPSQTRPGASIKHYDTSDGHVRASVDASLAALRCGHLDLLLIHRPDALLDPWQLAETFERLRREGKVRHFGVSNFSPAQFELLDAHVRLATNQIEWSPLHLRPLDDGTLEQATRLARAPMVWSPLAGGRLFRDAEGAAPRVRAVLEALARVHGVSPTTLALAWLRRHPSAPLPILGTGRLEPARDAVAALSFEMTREDWWRIWSAAAGRDVP